LFSSTKALIEMFTTQTPLGLSFRSEFPGKTLNLIGPVKVSFFHTPYGSGRELAPFAPLPVRPQSA
jgi:hypothetical protein